VYPCQHDIVIIHQGDPPGSLYFVSRGQVRVEMSQPSGETIRLRTMSEGTIIGELGLYLHKPASANVIAELPSVLYYLSADSLTAMEQGDPHIAAIFHKYLATALSKRLLDTNATVQALMG
jgi:SulP family sulfate permease